MTEPGKPGLVRAIGRWSLTALVVNSIIGSGVFGLPSALAGLTGAWSPLLSLIAAVPMAVIVACFAEVASRFTGAGGPYLYTHAAFGRFPGILTGWLAWLVRLTSAGAAANLFTVYLAEFWPRASETWVRAAVLALLMGLLALVNVRGVRKGALVSNVFTVSKLTPLAILIVAGLAWMAIWRGALPAQTFPPSGPKQWLDAVILLIFAYGGFEAAMMPMGEARNPRRDAPFALFLTLIGCIVIYTLVQVVVMGSLADPAASDRPLAAAARAILGRHGAVLVTLGALVSTMGLVSANAINAPRLTYALAEKGDFPRLFGALHERFRTPYVSILIYASLVWLLASFGTFRWNVVLSVVSRLVTYAFVCAALPMLRRKRVGEAEFRLPAGDFLGVLGATLSAALLVTGTGTSHAQIVGVVLVIALVNWLWVRRARAQALGAVS